MKHHSSSSSSSSNKRRKVEHPVAGTASPPADPTLDGSRRIVAQSLNRLLLPDLCAIIMGYHAPVAQEIAHEHDSFFSMRIQALSGYMYSPEIQAQLGAPFGDGRNNAKFTDSLWYSARMSKNQWIVFRDPLDDHLLQVHIFQENKTLGRWQFTLPERTQMMQVAYFQERIFLLLNNYCVYFIQLPRQVNDPVTLKEYYQFPVLGSAIPHGREYHQLPASHWFSRCFAMAVDKTKRILNVTFCIRTKSEERERSIRYELEL